MIEHVQQYLQQVEQIRQTVAQQQALEQAKLRLALVQYPTIEFDSTRRGSVDPGFSGPRNPQIMPGWDYGPGFSVPQTLPGWDYGPGFKDPQTLPGWNEGPSQYIETMPWWNDGPPQFIEAGPRG